MQRKWPWEALLVFSVSFLLLMLLRYENYWNVDVTGHLNNIFDGSRSPLGLGRPGFIFFYHGLWKLAGWLGLSDFNQFIGIMRVINVLLSSVFVATVYVLLVKLTGRKILPLFTVTLLTFHKGFIEYASLMGSDTIMFALVGTSYWLFARALEEKRKSLLFLSALAFGCAFEAREPAILFAAFFPVYLLGSQRKVFSVGIWLGAISILIGAALLGPLIFLLKYQLEYVSGFLFNMRIVKLDQDENFLIRLKMLLELYTMRPVPLIIPMLFGLGVAHWKPHLFGLNRKKLLLLWATLLTPSIAIVLLHSQWALLESRFAIPVIVGNCFLMAVAIEWIRLKCAKLRLLSYSFPAVALSCILMSHFAIRMKDAFEIDLESNKYEGYFQRIKPLLNENRMFLVGMEVYYVNLQAMVGKLPFNNVDPGWNWPGNMLASDVQNYLDSGMEVIYDPQSSWFNNNFADLETLQKKFIFEPMGQGFIRLKSRSD